MLPSQENRMRWGLLFAIPCIVILLALGIRANYPDEHYDPKRGATVGVDLGSEISRVGIIKDGKFVVLHEMPSCVAFTDRWPTILIGEEAKAQRSMNPARTICDPKFLVGQKWSDPDFQETIKGLDYRVVEGWADRAVISVKIRAQRRDFYPESITGMLMSRLRVKATEKLGEKVAYAVVAVPGHYDDDQRRIIKSAGPGVGLEVLRVINDYAAAGIAYDIDRTEGEANFIIMNLDSSKTEITAVFVEEGVMELLATVSEPAFSRIHNRRLVNYITSQCATVGTLLNHRAQIELEESLELGQGNRLFGPSAYCQRADFLHHCSGLPSCVLEDLTQDSDTGMSASVLEPLKRLLAGLNMSLEWEENQSPLKKEMPYTPSNISNVAQVIAVGSFSKSPMVTRLLEALRWDESWIHRDLDPEEAILKGAAIQAQVLSEPDGYLVSYADVTPVSLGLETSQGYMHKVTRRYTPIPTRKAQNLTTAYDNQESMLIRVFEGDRMMARDNFLVGELELKGIPHAPRHVPVVEVSFDLDAHSSLRVVARCLNTTIKASAIFKDNNHFFPDPFFAQRRGLEDEQDFEESTVVDKTSLQRYIEIVDRAIAREDVIDAPHNVDNYDLKKEANRMVRETGEWLATQSDTAPYAEFKSRKLNLWDVMQDLLHYNPPGRIYSVSSRNIVDRKHDEL